MTIDMPYFMTNEQWYYFDNVEKKYKLTETAPEMARKSYEQFWEEVAKFNTNRKMSGNER